MADRIKQIPGKLLEFWNKYTSKQKAVIISVVAVIVLAFALLYMTVTRVKYEEINRFDDAKSANELVTLLEEEKIKYKRSRDGTIIRVDSSRITDALVLMETNNIPNAGMSWDDAFKNSMSTTEQEKTMKFNLAFQNTLRRDLIEMFEGVKDAAINVTIPDSDTTIFAENQEATVSAMLELTDPISDESARGLAKYLAGRVGNSTTEKITIIDTSGKILFSGGDETGLGGSIGDVNEFKLRLQNQVSQNITDILIADGFQEASVSHANIVVNMDQVSELYEEYSVPDGMEQGYYSTSYEYSSKGNSGSGGVPGTDPNADDTDYAIGAAGTTESEVLLNKYEYLVNKKSSTIVKEAGVVDNANSSIAVVLKNYVIYDQETMENNGTLNGMTWEQFVEANNNRVAQTVDDHVVPLIAAATGIAENNIAVQLWDQPIFNNKVEEPFQISNYLMIILAVLIIALLIFVVFKGTAPVEVTETEPELSVEQLLATTKENQSLEDIEFSDMSETKKMIDKFVDENPDAVANLLRNWLNEDWA